MKKRLISQILCIAMSAAIVNVTYDKKIENNKDGYKEVYTWEEDKLSSNKIASTSKNSLLESEMKVDEKNIQEKEDLDNDGLEDGIEELFGADPNKKDTDEDGIDDLSEIKLSLNPADSDSNHNGIEDLKEDTDGDGLSNEEEIKHGTDCGNKDSDNDGIIDGDEVRIYKTSPLNNDTDGDSILDGDELKLGLNPNSMYSDGVTKDSQAEIQQVLSKERISQVIWESNYEFVPSISGKVPGLLDRNIYVNAYDTAPIEEVEGIAGGAIDIKSEYDSNYTLNLSFDCRKYLNNREANIENLSVYKYKDNKYAKLDTKIDSEKGIISTDINESGVYFIVDLEEDCKEVNDVFSAEKSYASISGDNDSDYDGIDDNVDSSPNNNSFSGTLKTTQAKTQVSYTMDYRNFFSSNKQFNSNIATVSSVFSAVTNHSNSFDGLKLAELMSRHGMQDVKIYNLASMYNDTHLSEAYIGHRKVSYKGKTKEIIAIVVRGTNGTVEEWSSNFDVGSIGQKSQYPDWKIISNHKGFDIAATRILRCLDEYEKGSSLDKDAQKTYWVMGHSRGGAISNILGARLVNDSKEVYAYTMAAPSTTTASDAEDINKYSGIYNVINKEDFVTLLPTSQWGFRHYGKSYVKSVNSDCKDEWEKLTKFNYKCDANGIDDTVNTLSKIINDRNDAYEYCCKCHGNGSRSDTTARNYGMSKNSREKAIAKIPDNALPYCQITRYDGNKIMGWDFTVCQQPEYFMQLLAAFMSNKISAFRFAFELDIAKRYRDSEAAIIKSGIIGVANPHYNESYYVLTKHI